MRVKISELKIGNRIRTNPGDLIALRDSMRRLGLLQPILIDSKYNLIAGFRRLESAKMLGWESIEARLIETRDKKERLLIEADENTTRRDFSPEEMGRVDKLLLRYSKGGIFWKFIAWLMDLFEWIFRRRS